MSNSQNDWKKLHPILTGQLGLFQAPQLVTRCAPCWIPEIDGVQTNKYDPFNHQKMSFLFQVPAAVVFLLLSTPGKKNTEWEMFLKDGLKILWIEHH